MRHMKVWFPEYFTEAHRFPGQGDVLVEELAKFGIDCQLKLTKNCSFIFCGTIWRMNMTVEERVRYPKIPTIHYNWDLYPFQLIERKDYQRANPGYWDPYLEELKTCRDIWVPSYCTTLRTREFTGRDSYVIKTSVRPWECDKVTKGDYAVDVIRKYPDFNANMTTDYCSDMNVVVTANTYEWEEFKKTIAGCRFMVSPQYEASTGGLTLLEGYWHGKPSLLSNSPRHGGVDYFGYKAEYFQWDNPILFREAMRRMYDDPPEIDIDKAREWITKEYSESAMAKRMADRFWELYDESN